MKSSKPQSIDEYIANFPSDTQKKLDEVRAAIRRAAPEAEETIKYDIPTFTFHGILVSFGAWKNHIGLYPVPTELEGYKDEISLYKGSKNTAKFPYDKPIPLSLIEEIVKFRMKKNLEKAQAKTKNRITANKRRTI